MLFVLYYVVSCSFVPILFVVLLRSTEIHVPSVCIIYNKYAYVEFMFCFVSLCMVGSYCMHTILLFVFFCLFFFCFFFCFFILLFVVDGCSYLLCFNAPMPLNIIYYYSLISSLVVRSA